ncbi:MAG: O-antigen ligase family protein [Bacilli bacterium]|nr:O-antigen ligase family protein [Bacilli bacterium]
MKKYLESNISLIIKVFLFIQPIIDILTSIMINYMNINITIGMIIRIIFLLFIIYFYLFVRKNISKYKLFYLLGVLLFFIMYLIVIIVLKDTSVLFYELSQMIKVLYFPILLTLIDKKDIDIKINDLINISIIYLVLILIPNILNISFNSYTQGKIGSVGLFNSGNEISAIMSMLTPFIIYYLFNKNNNIKKIILVLLMALTYFKMGSKIIIISLIVSIIFNIILIIKKSKVSKEKLLIGVLISIGLIIITIIVLPRTNFFYNIKLHLDYLGINSFTDIFTFNFINRFIFSDRLTFLVMTSAYYFHSSFAEAMFGLGFIHNYATDLVSLKLIEMDFFDVLFNMGVCGFILVLYPLAKEIYDIFKVKKNNLVIFVSILSIIIAFLVGHTIVSPAVSIFLIIVLKLNKEKESKK